MTDTTRATPDLEVLSEIERRLLWLSTRIVDEANRRPQDRTEVKVGGHQASSASMVSIMTALWFGHIGGADKVAVKPHASPVYHAIKYLTGELDRSYLPTLRQRAGLQAYPSRTKDPDVADFSTGSVGLGAVAPLFSALTRRYADHRFGGTDGPSTNGAATDRPARFIALVGDAELDEGNVWEAVSEPATEGLGSFTMVVDLNRQSLDRVIPDIAAARLERFFHHAGWHVVEAKYGSRLRAAFAEPGGGALRRHIDAMPNEAYQQLFGLDGDLLRATFLAGADLSVVRLADNYDNTELKALITDLGGHDLGLLLDGFDECDRVDDRPSVVFAYTIKGWGLPMAGDPLNHAALLTADQIDELRSDVGLTVDAEWDRLDPDTPAGRVCAAVGGDLNNPKPIPRPVPPVPAAARPPVTTGLVSTQEAFGRVLASLGDVDGVAERLVTTAPDVSISTNLGGWINKVGVYAPTERDDHGGADRLLKWAPSPSGQHIELGISEMNLFMLLGQLGLAHDHHGQHLLPIGAVYDPFVLRGLDALIYALYNGARFVVAGTPSGVTLAPEGGAHQSTITPSVGLELPGLTYAEPAFATEVDWLLCDAIDQLSRPDGGAGYLRLSTRPVDQAPFAAAIDRLGETSLRNQVLAGGYRIHESGADGPADGGDAGTTSDRAIEAAPGVTIVSTGVMVVEALAAAEALETEGVGVTVVHLTSPDRVYRSWQGGHATAVAGASAVRRPSHLHRLVPTAERSRPVVAVQDGASHGLAWVGSALGTRQISLGVDRFGESGTIADLYELTGISVDSIVNAALIAIHEG
ncbi:MAG: transketolase C-terminal domain-containing protein [Actinomycetota bacterium]